MGKSDRCGGTGVEFWWRWGWLTLHVSEGQSWALSTRMPLKYEAVGSAMTIGDESIDSSMSDIMGIGGVGKRQ